MKLTIPQIAEKLKELASQSHDKASVLNYAELLELSGWTRDEMDNYERKAERNRYAFWDDVATVGEIIGASIFFGEIRILSEIEEEAQ